MDREALRIPVPVTPGFGQHSLLPDKRVVGRDATVVVQPNDDPVVVRAVLGGVRLEVAPRGCLAVAGRDEDVAAGECDPGTVVPVSTAGDRFEELFDICQGIVFELAPDQRGRGLIVGLGLRKSDVQPVVVREVRVWLNVE